MLLMPHFFIWFTLAFGLMLLATFIMGQQGKLFYTMDVVERKFSMLDLEFAATPQELATIIQGIYKLPEGNNEGVWRNRSHKVVKALRGQLILDTFLFMPATYGAIFLLCIKVATKMGEAGQKIFIVLALLQALAFVLDLIENVYLFLKIKRHTQPSSAAMHKAYQVLEALKWSSALTAMICGFSAALYFWVIGKYQTTSYPYLIILVVEIALFFFAQWLVKKTDKNKGKPAMNTIGAGIITVQSN